MQKKKINIVCFTTCMGCSTENVREYLVRQLLAFDCILLSIKKYWKKRKSLRRNFYVKKITKT